MYSSKLNETLGLVAHYASIDIGDKDINELKTYRNDLLKDFARSKTDKNINYLLWIMKSYPRFLAEALGGKHSQFSGAPNLLRKNKQSIIENLKKGTRDKNLYMDRLVKRFAPHIFIKKYIDLKMKGKQYIEDDFLPKDDSEEVMVFLISFDFQYQQEILKKIV